MMFCSLLDQVRNKFVFLCPVLYQGKTQSIIFIENDCLTGFLYDITLSVCNSLFGVLLPSDYV